MIINCDKTHIIIRKFNKPCEKNFVNHLSAYPNLQLEYMQRLLKERERGEKIDNDLLVLFIKLLCELDPTKVLAELMNYVYPLDECLKLCNKFGVNDAAAYLLERTGAI